jgi:ADP-ribose pyrophosphatase YjhB (NUDIX family)
VRDHEEETVEATALREVEEEIGISKSEIETFGTLPAIWTPSGFTVTPVVGLLRAPIEEVIVRPNPEEIDFWFWCQIERLRAPEIYSTENREIEIGGKKLTVQVDVFQVDDHRIWGATGAMLKNFLGRLERAESKS